MFNQGLQRYGTALEPLDEDALPSKKPIRVEDQIVTDENGRRRFHGAFTGGFSAGFWNTVGSQEGWTPQSFKSSRSERSTHRTALKPEDFMDDEDLGEFGIAPQRIKPRKDFSVDDNDEKSRKRKFMPLSTGPIPGVPVLEQLLKPIEDKVGVRIMKKMGWRPGQGVGPRQTRKEKKKARERNKKELYLMQNYGCELPKGSSVAKMASEESESSSDNNSDHVLDDEITFAPDDVTEILPTPKDNCFGLGYEGLSREPVLSSRSKTNRASQKDTNTIYHVTKGNKAISISGQAFGVGALEEEDEDIYATEDMSRYDFSLDDKKPKKKLVKHIQDIRIIDGFCEAKEKYEVRQIWTVDVPADFVPRNWAMRKSRFTPLDPEKVKQLQTDNKFKKIGLGRHDLTPDQRGQLYGEASAADDNQATTSKQTAQKSAADRGRSNDERSKALLEKILGKGSSFTKGGIITTDGEEQAIDANEERERKTLQEKASQKTKNLTGVATETFKPFLGNAAKQARYEKFVEARLSDENAIRAFLNDLQPMNMSEWDREMEQKEFIQARQIYKPLVGLMSDRFISETEVESKKIVVEEKKKESGKIIMERTKSMWKPSSLLCKRYNIPEPFGGTMADDKHTTKNKAKISVFDYLEASVNTKTNFQTPVIIPKHIEKPMPIVKNSIEPLANTRPPQASPKDATAHEPEKKSHAPPEANTLLFKPKTELEKMVIDSVDKPPEDKIDLFRAIFEDSDEDDERSEVAPALELEEPAEQTVASPVLKATSARAANLLRNTSPPKGIFASLFSGPSSSSSKQAANERDGKDLIATSSPIVGSDTAIPAAPEPVDEMAQRNNAPKILFQPKSARMQAEEKAPDSGHTEAVGDGQPTDVYGPQIPAHLMVADVNKPSPAEVELNLKLLRYLNQQREKVGRDDEWVEKTGPLPDSSLSSGDDSDSSSNSSILSSEEERHRKKSTKSSKKKKRKERDKKKSKKKERKKSSKNSAKRKKKKHK